MKNNVSDTHIVSKVMPKGIVEELFSSIQDIHNGIQGKILGRFHKVLESVEEDVERFDVHKDIFKCTEIPDEVPDLEGYGTGIRLDKNGAIEVLDKLHSTRVKVLIGFLRKNEAPYGMYKISGVIGKYGNKRIVTYILFDDFVDVTGFQTRLETLYIEPSKEETFEDSLSVLLGI